MLFFDSPIYWAGHFVHSIRYRMLFVWHVICFLIWYVLLVLWLRKEVVVFICLQDTHGLLQGSEPGGGVGGLGLLVISEFTRWSLRFLGLR